MINVFVFQSSLEALEMIRRSIVEYFHKVKRTFRITACYKFEEAVKYLNKRAVQEDILLFDFSDFEMGYQLALCLRNYNERASWMYLNGEVSDFLRTLLLRPSAYVPVSSERGKLLEAFRDLERIHFKQSAEQFFTFKFEGELIRLPYDEISYIESNAKKATLHLFRSEKKYYFTAKLDDIFDTLPSFFLRCHQSYIVNMKLIRKLDIQSHTFLLLSNEEVLISRRMYTESRERYYQYLAEKGSPEM